MNKHELYMEQCKLYSKFSKCQFTQVGAIAVNENGRIIATGVNGTLSGSKNCCDVHFDSRDDHVEFTKNHEIHAEANLLLELALSSVTFKNLTVYLTISPCPECFKLLMGLTRQDSRVKMIVYNEKYHRVPEHKLEQMKQVALNNHSSLCSLTELLEEEN